MSKFLIAAGVVLLLIVGVVLLPRLTIELDGLSAAGSTTTELPARSAGEAGTADVPVLTLTSASANSAGSAAEPTVGAAGSAVAAAMAVNQVPHDEADDYAWETASETSVTLNGDSILVEGDGVTVEATTAAITAPGTYRLSGTLNDGQIVVNSESQGLVRLVLDGVSLYNSYTAPIYVEAADEVMVVLADGSQNLVTDSAKYLFPAIDVTEPNATIFSAADLTFTGSGTLTVSANWNDAITSKDGLVINGGTLFVTAVDDGIRGKDYVVVRAGDLSVVASGDALKADNADEADRGYVLVEGGTLNLTAGGDGIDAETDALVTGGALTLVAGGGSGQSVPADASAKGIKGTISVIVDGGTFTMNAADDAVHSNGSIKVNGGLWSIATSDDGMHADATLTIAGGVIDITRSYEGLESAVITIDAGEISVVASDDGINVAGGVDGSGLQPGGGRGGAMPPGGNQAQETFSYSGDYWLYLNGGTLLVNADGDGLDANGAIAMTGGLVLVDGPTNNGNGALDYDGGFTISGGVLVAAGSSGMAQAPGAYSSQNSLLVNFGSAVAANTPVTLVDASGQALFTFTSAKNFQSLLVSSAELQSGATYTLYGGGSSTGEAVGGLIDEPAYVPGTSLSTLTLTGVTTMLGGRTR